MAAKRLLDQVEDKPNQKQAKPRSSFASAIGEVLMANFFEGFCSTLEPMLRRVVSEEVENGVRAHCQMMMSSPPALMPELDAPGPQLRLRFSEKLSLPIFTGTKIVDAHGGPLRILLVDAQSEGNSAVVPISHDFPIKIELLVLDGDFAGDLDDAAARKKTAKAWTEEEFEKSIVRERSGKRPLLAARGGGGGDGGDLRCIAMRDGVACVSGGDIELTDNSSWIRSRRFRLGARVVARGTDCGAGRVREAITEPFVVKDHRGESYKKHHPPSLDDEVWRLEKIGKGGVFHQKLAFHHINTVQDFLKLFNVNPSKLRKILGIGMSDKMWGSIVKHAKNCVLGTKFYTSHGNNYTLTFNSICQLVKAEFNSRVYQETELKDMQTPYIESLVKDAYAKWSELEESDGRVRESGLLSQGDLMVGQQPLAALVDSRCSGFMHNYNIKDAVDGAYTHDWPLNFYPAIKTMTSSSYTKPDDIRFSYESSSESDIL